MKKAIYLILLTLSSFTLYSQAKGTRIGFIDMEYILEKVPNYAEAKNQLELKAQKWKQEIEVKKNEIDKLKSNLKTEAPLLTKELIEEREDEIKYLEEEMLDYQQGRFGPAGDLILQKTILVKPIQDQVFSIVQDIAIAKNFDFIFDKSSDKSMLFVKNNLDISDQVIRQLLRAEKREQLTAKQLKDQEAKDALEDMQDENPELAARQKALDEKKAAREKAAEEKRQAYEDRKKEAADKRKKLQEEREAKKNGTQIEGDTTDVQKTGADAISDIDKKKAEAAEKRQKAIDDRNKAIEERKKAAQEKREKILADREAAKKAREENKKEE
ncbi:OmpH family outer membrane protein [Flavobacterium sp.]|uniref:OmpH family outer membrane protein n=1 Tax=Flavobacterium sp. TaxID=239 RepID=UPI003F69E691